MTRSFEGQARPGSTDLIGVERATGAAPDGADDRAAVERLLAILRRAAVSALPGDAILEDIGRGGPEAALPGELREVAVLSARIVEQSTAMLQARINDIVHLEDELEQIEARAEQQARATAAEAAKVKAAVDDRTMRSLRSQLAEARKRARRAERQVAMMQNSISWRLTRPLRAIRRMMFGQG